MKEYKIGAIFPLGLFFLGVATGAVRAGYPSSLKPSHISRWALSGNGRNLFAHPAELAQVRRWVQAKFANRAGAGPYTTTPPFSFDYAGRSTRNRLKSWLVTRKSRRLLAQGARYVVTYKDPRTGLVVRCTATVYRDFPIVRWTLSFQNTGVRNTPILSDIQVLHTSLQRHGAGGFVLHYNRGSYDSPLDFEPLRTVLTPGTKMNFAPVGGRPTNHAFPYYNVHWSNNGCIVVVGWPGQWASRFQSRRAGNGESLRIEAGQQLTHFILHPGEKVTSPRIALEFYQGDWIRGQNIWRRWMMSCILPRPGGKLPPPRIAATASGAYQYMQHATTSNQIAWIRRYQRENLKINAFWMDAGWYPDRGKWWLDSGRWNPDPRRFPQGIRPISNYAHARGIKTILWFEPERVVPGRWLAKKYPQWLLTAPKQPNELFNLGDPAARRWMTYHIYKIIQSQGIDIYRQDFNMNPLVFWRDHDSPNRRGITQIRYVEGLLAFWDALRRAKPDLLIDTCASGGRRLDLDTLHRAVPLWRSDDSGNPIVEQDHTYGIALWIPYYGTAITGQRPYTFRSQMTPALSLCWDVRQKNLNYALLRRMLAQWNQIKEDYFGDYYPLTPYRTGKNARMAWEFNRPDLGRGMVQIFRRQDCSYQAIHIRLHGLTPQADYLVTNVGVPGSTAMTGRALMRKGMVIELPARPTSALIEYQRVGKKLP